MYESYPISCKEEMDVDDAPYKVLLSDGTEFLVKKEIFEHFGTMMKMLEYTVFDKSEPILLTAGNMTPANMKAFIDFYTIYDNVRYDTGMNAVARRIIPRNMQRNDSEDYREWVFIMSDWDETVAFLKVADQLEASEVIVFLVDRLREELQTLPTKQLETRLARLRGQKRKNPDTKERAQRVHYRRAYVIGEILNASVREDYERGVDRRIKKYINPLNTSPYITTIQQEPITFVHDRYTEYVKSDDVQPKQDLEVLEEGKQRAIFSEMTTEIVTGLLFYAFLTENGELNLFGSLWFNRDMTGIGNKVVPTKSLPLVGSGSAFNNCIGVWHTEHYILITTLEGLFAHSLKTKMKPSSYEISKIEGIKPDDLIDISCYVSHAFILSRHGMFYWDYEDNKTMKIEPRYGEVIETFITLAYAMYILTKTGHLYVLDMGFYYRQKQPKWQLIKFEVVIDHSFPTLFSFSPGQLLLLVNNKLMRIMRDPDDGDVVSVIEVPFAGEGEILHLCSVLTGRYRMPIVLVDTTTGLYIVKDSEEEQYYDHDPLTPFLPVTRLGDTSTYKVLSIRVPEILEKNNDEEQGSQKKARISISCQMCSAHGELLHKATSVFCSHYCFHSSQSELLK